MLTLVGGKLTTFRASAETITDRALAELGAARKVSTAERAIGGGQQFPASDRAKARWIAAASSPLSSARLRALLERYGSYAASIADYIADRPDEPLRSAPEYSTAEIEYLSEQESVVHLSDLLRRRTNLAFTGVSASGIAEIAEIVAPILGWDSARIASEVAAAEEELLPRTRFALAATAE